MLQIMKSSLRAGLRIVVYTLDWFSRIWWGSLRTYRNVTMFCFDPIVRWAFTESRL